MIYKTGYEFLLLNHPFLLHCTSALSDIEEMNLSPCNRGGSLTATSVWNVKSLAFLLCALTG